MFDAAQTAGCVTISDTSNSVTQWSLVVQIDYFDPRAPEELSIVSGFRDLLLGLGLYLSVSDLAQIIAQSDSYFDEFGVSITEIHLANALSRTLELWFETGARRDRFVNQLTHGAMTSGYGETLNIINLVEAPMAIDGTMTSSYHQNAGGVPFGKREQMAAG